MFSVGRLAKKKDAKKTHKAGKETQVVVSEGIVDIPEVFMKPIATKIVFLGEKNLDKLRGYKAYLDLRSESVCLTLTGLSLQSARRLFDSIEKMKDEEIHGE